MAAILTEQRRYIETWGDIKNEARNLEIEESEERLRSSMRGPGLRPRE
ncbi:MAG: hypothetical protein A4E32_01198 [Methanomassiliicoccales archaeon PtaU1.Bin124]|nr:MAG: hypothetical protein A4E32_01198 [Methanomassiliicoccales archaeon PtaU1.Bin124]